jgi:hypothetical protein
MRMIKYGRMEQYSRITKSIKVLFPRRKHEMEKHDQKAKN